MDWFDTNADGFSDFGKTDTNGDGYYDQAQVDTDFDGFVDASLVDTNMDGYWDTTFLDPDQDGVNDAEGWDTDADDILDYYANAATGWSILAVPTVNPIDTIDPSVIGPPIFTSPQVELAGLPVNDVYTAIALNNLIFDVNNSPWY